MKKLRAILKWFFLIWGVVSFIGVLIFGGFFAYSIGSGNRDREGAASVSDVRFVLNWCRLGDERAQAVVHSHESARSFTGDHMDAYAIQVSHISASELTTDGFEGGWVRGDEATPVLRQAIELVHGFITGSQIDWFPSDSDLVSEHFYIWTWRVTMHGSHVSAAQLIFAHPNSKMVYYASVKM